MMHIQRQILIYVDGTFSFLSNAIVKEKFGSCVFFPRGMKLFRISEITEVINGGIPVYLMLFI